MKKLLFNMDFSLIQYNIFLKEISDSKYIIIPFKDYGKYNNENTLILRHDVDRKPENALAMALLENTYGIKSSYYFRIVSESFAPSIINKIAKLGHEIGYHYEDLSLMHGNYSKAIIEFEKNLKKLKHFYDVKTMCMHGSPLSKWDNRLLWKKYDYKKFGIISEPYLELDFNKIFYITDAGRSWNDKRVSMRDKVNTQYEISINSINDIISLIKQNKLPNHLMLNIHPHNWAKNHIEWLKIQYWQGFKNQIKRLIIRYNANS